MKKALSYMATWLVLAALVILVISSTVKNSVIQLPPHVKEFTHTVFPEGWSFFTRSPREEMADIYEVTKDRKLKKISSQCSAGINFFGISRRSRKIGMELSIIAANLKDSVWLKEDSSTQNLDSLPLNKIAYDNENKFIPKGEYVIIATTPIPWAWSENKKTHAKERLIRIQIL